MTKTWAYEKAITLGYFPCANGSSLQPAAFVAKEKKMLQQQIELAVRVT